MARITTHIQYGTKAPEPVAVTGKPLSAAAVGGRSKRPVPAHGFIASAERKRAGYRVDRRKYPKLTDEQVIEWLRGIATRGERMPTSDEIADTKGENVNHTVRRLAYSGACVIYVTGHNWRHIEIDGLSTMKAPGKGHPYLRIGKEGRQYWNGERWLAR
jgi:hypothetical protein